MTYGTRPDVNGLSPLATVSVPVLRDIRDRTAPVYGVAVHCTGSGIVEEALKAHCDPFELACERYANAQRQPYFAHHIIGYDGRIAQVADEHEDAQHVGFPAADRAAFLDGSWSARLGPGYVTRWRARWPGVKSPAHLFPGSSTNNVLVGMELLVWVPGCPGERPAGSLRYTPAQHESAGLLAADIADRWDFPVGWQRTGRLAAHEDLNPLARVKDGQGWDPGVLRDSPWFDWRTMLEAIDATI